MSVARLCSLFAFAVLCLTATSGARAGDISVDEVIAKITPSGSGGAFMAITNSGNEDDSLVGVSSPSANKAMLHTTKEVDGVMKMRKVDAVPVPAGKTTMLQHGGEHVMLFGVPKGLKPGDSIDLVLVFDKAGEVPVTAMVQAPGMAAMGEGHSMNQDMGEGEEMNHEAMAAEAATAPMPMTPVEVTVNRISAEGVGESIGTLTLTAQEGGVLLTPALSGLEPGPHAFHVHKKPNCGPREKDGKMVAGLAAGGHFDPGHMHKKDKKAKKEKMAKKKLEEGGEEMNMQPATADGHGDHMHKPAGDLPELMVDSDGNAAQPIEVATLTLKQMMGRSIMIHASGEKSANGDKPKGGGARIACAIVPK